jgi:hypothetical protein
MCVDGRVCVQLPMLSMAEPASCNGDVQDVPQLADVAQVERDEEVSEEVSEVPLPEPAPYVDEVLDEVV